MEMLKFTIEEKAIAELLGRQFYSTKESAIFELIKNSYDAGSNICKIYITNESIKIIDDGIGMDLNDIKNSWMHIGRSTKGYKNENNNRIYAGSKGVGRFALARLGNNVKVFSKKLSTKVLLWETDWLTSNLKEIEKNIEKGTNIEIYELREIWKYKDIVSLTEFLGRAYNSKEMKIKIYFENETFTVSPIFEKLIMGVNYASKIHLKYDHKKMTLKVEVNSDEFKEEVNNIVSPISPNKYYEEFNISYELNLNMDNLDSYLHELGSFDAELYFALDRTTSEVYERFKYKNKSYESPRTGVILYRNAFSISSLEGTKDWLDITSRARKSPAAATHLTGSWRVRGNQIFGFVSIDKVENKHLKDLSNRQGLEENEYYEVFKEIIHFGVGRFERYRQSIIRKISSQFKNDEDLKQREENKNLREFLKSPQKVSQMSETEISSIAQEIIQIKKEAEKQYKERQESEQQHKYDVRILNSLATQGLRASAVAHELHNKRNFLETAYQYIISALEKYEMWEVLNSDEYTKYTHQNVPKLLNGIEEINIKLIIFIDVILQKIEKEKFNSKIKSIKESIELVINTWREQYQWLTFNLEINEPMPEKYIITKDVIDVIFDNLILNSIQHNESKDKLNINISVEKRDGDIIFSYSDNGSGLNNKYKQDPKRILEVHETSRKEGHGLGMWIINNTLHMFGGRIIDIKGDEGFMVKFSIKG